MALLTEPKNRLFFTFKIRLLVLLASLFIMAFFAVTSKKKQNNLDLFSPGQQEVLSSLTVLAIKPIIQEVPITLSANGSIIPWQESVISAGISGLMINEVNTQIGDYVRKGQVLAKLDDDFIQSDVKQAKALVAETEATLHEAKLNLKRIDRLKSAGAITEQQISQYETNSIVAQAKTESARAQLEKELLRLLHTRIVATDDGLISLNNATPGTVVFSGQELFKLIRQNRLQWRAEVTAEEMIKLHHGIKVKLYIPDVANTYGVIRALDPKIDNISRNGFVYVDLPQANQNGLRSGMYARGEFELGSKTSVVLPQDAISIKDGYYYIYKLNALEGSHSAVSEIKINIGHHIDEHWEILSDIDSDSLYVGRSASFLSDGSVVKVVRQ